MPISLVIPDALDVNSVFEGPEHMSYDSVAEERAEDFRGLEESTSACE